MIVLVDIETDVFDWKCEFVHLQTSRITKATFGIIPHMYMTRIVPNVFQGKNLRSDRLPRSFQLPGPKKVRTGESQRAFLVLTDR